MEIESSSNKPKMAKSSYKSLAKSSGVVAFVQVFQLILGMVRNKVVAIHLGTEGFGIWGLYQTFLEMVSSFSTLGVNQSGVREIAKKDKFSIETAKSISSLGILVGLFSLISTIIIIFFSELISLSLFNSKDYSIGVMISGFAILFHGLFNSNKTILNGIRDIRGLALSQIISAIVASFIAILLIYLLKEDGIAISLLIISMSGALISYLFIQKNRLKTVLPTMKEFKSESKDLIKLGLGFSSSAAIAALATYLSRTYLVSQYDLGIVGIYQASWTISNLYVGIILAAMGVDFMPRLTQLISDKTKMNSLVNDQLELGVLISSIGVVFIIAYSDLILEILYSSNFKQGQSIIKWQILGVFLRVLGYPFSHLLMANKKALIYAIVQFIFWFGDYLLLILLINTLGVTSLGLNYFLAYAIYLVLIWIICYRIFQFRSSKLVKRIVLIAVLFIFSSIYLTNSFSTPLNYLLNILVISAMAFWINGTLKKHMGISIVSFLKHKIKK